MVSDIVHDDVFVGASIVISGPVVFQKTAILKKENTQIPILKRNKRNIFLWNIILYL